MIIVGNHHPPSQKEILTTQSLVANETVDNFIERPLSDRTAEKGTVGSEAAVLENVLLEHLSTTKPTIVGQSSHTRNSSAAQPDPHRSFGGVWPCGCVQTASACKPHPSAGGQHGLNLREIVEANPPASRTQSKKFLHECDSLALRDSGR
jgi:hypothetical protein